MRYYIHIELTFSLKVIDQIFYLMNFPIIPLLILLKNRYNQMLLILVFEDNLNNLKKLILLLIQIDFVSFPQCLTADGQYTAHT